MTLDPRFWRPECNHYQHLVLCVWVKCMFTPCKGIRILKSNKIFPCGMQEIFYCAVWNPEHWNPGCSSRNPECPTNDWTRNVSSTDKDWNPVSGIWNPEFKTSWITLQGVSMCTTFALHLPLKGKYFCQSYLKIFKVYNIIPKLHKNKVCS